MIKLQTVKLVFDPALDDAKGHKELRDGLSAVLQIGPTLWLANDESATLERLSLKGAQASGHVQFQLGKFLDLPDGGAPEDVPEVDIEGMDWDGSHLWIVGSHSRKRTKVDAQDSPARTQKNLACIDAEANRFLLARIPVMEQDGLPTLVRKAKPHRAQQLRRRGSGNELTHLLRKDKHLGPFMRLPGKENGFDIEGLVVAGERVFLGLRGPVLQGWAMVLELRPVGDGDGLDLGRLDGPKAGRVRKHFLQLQGLGVRDLCRDGDDLLILAGPTMLLDGPVRVLRWPGALLCEGPCVVPSDKLQHVLEVPFGVDCDHAEGMALYRRDGRDPPALLVVYDSPAPRRQPGSSSLMADVFKLPVG